MAKFEVMNHKSADEETKPASCLAPLQRDRQTKSAGFVAIHNLPGYFFNERLEIIGPKGWKLKIRKCNRGGYPIVGVIINGKNKIVRLHRLIALQFIPNPLNLPQVNHINGIKSDYSIKNLEWCTPHSNVQHAYDIGLKKGMVGIKHPLAKIDRAGVIAVRDARGLFHQDDVARYFGMRSRTTISAIQRGVNWAHI